MGFNPRSPCGERRLRLLNGASGAGVSTHAPLAGSDLVVAVLAQLAYVSTHAPLAGSDVKLPSISVDWYAFQPTLPLRGATPFAV